MNIEALCFCGKVKNKLLKHQKANTYGENIHQKKNARHFRIKKYE